MSVVVLGTGSVADIQLALQGFENCDDVAIVHAMPPAQAAELQTAVPRARLVWRENISIDPQDWRNWREIQFKHQWLYCAAAGEEVTAALRDEILRIVADASAPHAAWEVLRKIVFMGKTMRFGQARPSWRLRLVRLDRLRDGGTTRPAVGGAVGRLTSPLLRHEFEGALARHLRGLNYRSQVNANEAVDVVNGMLWRQLKGLFTANARRRAAALRNLSYFLPGRDLFHFLYNYVLQGGFLDGRAGFRYAVLGWIYEYWVDIKVQERQYPWRRKTNALVKRLLTEELP